MKPLKHILLLAMLLHCFSNALIAQVKHHKIIKQTPKKAAVAIPKPVVGSAQYKQFTLLLNQANLTFTLPKTFREIKAVNNEDFSFDYAMEIPDQDFEIWFQVKPQKENWASYQLLQNDAKRRLENPDSLYLDMGRAQATAFTGDRNYFTRNIPPNILSRYNADAGKSYLLNLLDLPATRHYKYALLITLQRNHTGAVIIVCFTNEKDPEFFKNIDKAGNCLKFKS